MTYCYYNNFDDDEICEHSGWYNWGRWALLGVILGAMLLFVLGFVLFSYISTRKRAKSGLPPYRMTGWAAPPAYSETDPNPKEQELGNYPQPPPPVYGNEQGVAAPAQQTRSGERGEV